jgi:hypothetical protein
MVAVRSNTIPQASPAILTDGPLLRPARRDALPEHTQYTDSGCSLHPSCLTCPLLRCRYDEPGGARRLLSGERDRSIRALQRDRVPINSIAARFGISRRTVFRVLARQRAGSGAAEEGEGRSW